MKHIVVQWPHAKFKSYKTSTRNTVYIFPVLRLALMVPLIT